MVIEKLILEESTNTASDSFSRKFNLITSNEVNSTGKSTYCRLIFYVLGYTIPSTEGINFDRVDTTIKIEINGQKLIVKRTSKILSVKSEDGAWSKIFTLPDEHISFIAYIFNLDNLRIASNLLGLMYIDQEKGWTLLNRGKVIGNNRFSIDELVSALKNIDCEDLFKERDAIEREIDKYNAMLNMNSIKEDYYENNNNLEVVTLGDDIKKKIASVQLAIQNIKQSIDEITKVIKQDKSFFEYIEAMSLYVKTSDGLVKVTKDNIENSCNIEYLKAEKSLLMNSLSRLEGEKAKLVREYESVIYGTNLFKENITIDTEKKINSALSSINIDVEAIKDLLKQAKKEHEGNKSQIKAKIRQGNEYISQIYELFLKFAQQLNVEESISNKIDYIFTDNLKGKTGAQFQKLIIAYKVAVIKIVEKVINTKLFLVIDSLKAKELDDKNTKQIMEFLQRELSDNQVIIASIYSQKDFFVGFDKVIIFKNKAIEPRK